jgi:hypothetical protein
MASRARSRRRFRSSTSRLTVQRYALGRLGGEEQHVDAAGEVRPSTGNARAAPERSPIVYEVNVNVSGGRVLPAWRTTAARILLGLAAAGAVVSFASGVGRTMDAGPATQAVEAWRTLGFAAFAGLFALLAWRPLGYPGVFEIVIANKAALAVLGLTILASADGASDFVVFDGILTIALVAAYVLVDGWTAWRRGR